MRVSDPPLAEVATAAAIAKGKQLVIYVSGYTDGANGRLEISRSPTREHPPSFIVSAFPGNPGTVPGQSPKHRPTWAIELFPDDVGNEIGLRHKHGKKVIPVRRATSRSLIKSEEGTGEDSEWWAIEDRMPPGPPTLRVAGVLTAPTPRYKAVLSPAQPQGTNPAILILALTVTKPSGFVPQVITPLPVRYEAEVSEGQYTGVDIRADGELLTEDEHIEVEVVH